MGMRIGMALVAGTLAIGLTGTALAQDATSTSYGKDGLKFSTGDAFSMKISNLLQSRLTLVDNRETNSGPQDYGVFSIRRYETKFEGSIYDKKFTYKTELQWPNMAAGTGLQAAEMGYKFNDSMTLNMGRTKLDYNLQNTASSGAQQFVDRSDASERFNVGYGTGAWVKSSMDMGDSGNKLGWSLGVFNGLGGDLDQQNDFASGAGQNGQVGHKFSYNARAQMTGNAKAAPDLTAGESDLRGDDARKELAYLVGLGLNLTTWGRADTPGNANPAQVWNKTLDARVHYQGWAINAAFFHRSVEFDLPSNSALAKGYTDVGGYVAVGYNMNLKDGEQFEVAGRVSLVDHDDDAGGNADDRMETTVGANYRLKGDNVKFAFDATYMDVRPHGAVNDPHPSIAYRLQMQFRF